MGWLLQPITNMQSRVSPLWPGDVIVKAISPATSHQAVSHVQLEITWYILRLLNSVLRITFLYSWHIRGSWWFYQSWKREICKMIRWSEALDAMMITIINNSPGPLFLKWLIWSPFIGLKMTCWLCTLSKILLTFSGGHDSGQPPARCHGHFMFHLKISFKMLKFLVF